MKAYMVYGANTEVGKTVLTSALCRAIAGNDIVRYLKPVSTGGPEEADDR
jgi:dethiobiotin synthetase/adenosylmethionine--8-amino-7-oxononanoate aminotransferase